MWCFTISWQGSKKEPFRRVCSANDAANWEVQYHRTLIREVKTITKCAMILTVSVTSGELIIDGEPVNAAVFKSVILRFLITIKYNFEITVFNIWTHDRFRVSY